MGSAGHTISGSVGRGKDQADAAVEPEEAGWKECPACGKIQSLAPAKSTHDRRCLRCGESLGSGLVHLPTLLPILVCGLILFVLVAALPLLTVSEQGQHSAGYLLTAALGFSHNGMQPLALFTFAFMLLAPLGRLAIQNYVVVCVLTERRSKLLTRLYRLSESLRPWEMLDVFLVGTLIAMTKLRDLVDVHIAPGLWVLMALVWLLALFDSIFDRHRFWDYLEAPTYLPVGSDRSDAVSCTHCRLLQPLAKPASHDLQPVCRRCGAALHRRKPQSVKITWALIASAAVLYIPANLYPVFTIVSFGRGNTTTIIGGVRQLMDGSDWPLAVIIFVASIAVPLIKLIGLSWLLIAVQHPSPGSLHLNGRLHRLIEIIGRWSATDVFVAGFLCGLVNMDNLATIVPGLGVIAFAAVVFLTMVATMTFDQRLLWDAAEGTNG